MTRQLDLFPTPTRKAPTMPKLTPQQLDRAAGTLLGGAVGDALGVPYEFGTAHLAHDARPQMVGGGLGNYAPGQWSDDTEMASIILQVAATGARLYTPAALDQIAAGFVAWKVQGPADIGNQTSAVLSRRPASGKAMTAAARAYTERTTRSAGNGSLMRTAPVALAHLGDQGGILKAASAVSALTHYDGQAQDACVLWCAAISHAVLTGALDIRVGLPLVEDQDYWEARIVEAEEGVPADFRSSNGWCVAALQAAWCAVDNSLGYEDGIEAAVHGGGDTDTVAAIAGALLGACYGASTIPARWRRMVHGYPGLRGRDLVRMAVQTARHAVGDTPVTDRKWPVIDTMRDNPEYRGKARVVAHPDDAGVLMGNVAGLRPGVADAVVSLCRLGDQDVPLAGVPSVDHVEVHLVDKAGANLDLPAVFADTARVIRQLREEGKTVYVHCVRCESRTPTVAAAYGALITGRHPLDALDRVLHTLQNRIKPTGALVEGLANTTL